MRILNAASALVVLAGALSCGGTVVFEDDIGSSSAGGGSASSSTHSSSQASSGGAPSSSASSSATTSSADASASSVAGTGGGPVDPPQPTALYVRDRACGFETPVGNAMAELTRVPDSGDRVLVAELAFVDECTGAGGQHLLARAVDGSEMMWIGSHACYFFDPALVGSGTRAGVVRARPDFFEQISRSVCIEFPGVPGAPSTDVDAMAIAVFESLEDAEAFAAFVP